MGHTFDVFAVAILTIGIVFALSALAFVIFAFVTSEEPDTTTDNQSHDFNNTVDDKPDKRHKAGWKDVQPRDVDDVADIPGRTQTISETVASWNECMDMAHERVGFTSRATALMLWDIVVCDKLFPADGVAVPDLAVPGVVP